MIILRSLAPIVRSVASFLNQQTLLHQAQCYGPQTIVMVHRQQLRIVANCFAADRFSMLIQLYQIVMDSIGLFARIELLICLLLSVKSYFRSDRTID
jgi:hypothetical protein